MPVTIQMTGNVRKNAEFCQMTSFGACNNGTEVYPGNENKAVLKAFPGTKVTSGFGPASANIKHDCVSN
jgi:hypothetical protein